MDDGNDNVLCQMEKNSISVTESHASTSISCDHGDLNNGRLFISYDPSDTVSESFLMNSFAILIYGTKISCCVFITGNQLSL